MSYIDVASDLFDAVSEVEPTIMKVGLLLGVAIHLLTDSGCDDKQTLELLTDAAEKIVVERRNSLS